MAKLLSAEQAAARLGVQLKTVYAYVSRGVLTRSLSDDGRKSLFRPEEVDRLARRGRPRQGTRPLGGIDVSIATSITSIQPERLSYRGHDVTTLCDAGFESAAQLLWTGQKSEPGEWSAGEADSAIARLATAQLPEGTPAIERYAFVTAALACRTPLRVDLQPAAVMRLARRLIATCLESLPLLAAARARRSRVAARLWPRLTSAPEQAAKVACVDAALVLLADHELATSTLAARVAASTRADPCAVVLAGLGAVSGPLHGKAALVMHELLLSARALGSPERALAQTIGQHRMVPGFAHPVYRGMDPRAQCLLERLLPLCRRADQQIISTLIEVGSATTEGQPNVDFALAALAFGLDMPMGATEAVFALARMAGWIAHALEEYGETPLRFRARALYVGELDR
jgi:citrate synthase